MGKDRIEGERYGKSGSRRASGPDDLWGNRQRSGPDARLADCPGFAATVDAVLDAGGLFMAGRTSDGGAICVTIKLGERNWRTYVSKQDELDEVLGQAFNRFASV